MLEIGGQVVDGSLPWPEAYDLPEGVALDEYLRLALERNPRIVARVRDLQALGLRVPQVTSLADPMLSVTPPTGDMIQTAAGEMDGAIGVTQGFPFPGKLASQGRIAEQVVRVALENLRAERLSVVAAVKQAYYAYSLACVSIDVTRENLQLLTRLRDVAQAKYVAGRAPQQDLLRAEVELYNVSNELITLEQKRQTAVARIDVLIDRDVQAPLPVPDPVTPLGVAVRIDALIEQAVQENPALASWREQAAADLEAVHLAELQYYPDFSIGALFTFISNSGVSPVADGGDAWSLGLGLSLPIWLDRLRAGVLERHARVLATAERYRGARNDVLFAVQDLSVRVDAAFRRAILLRDGILPRARQTVQVSESGYQAGEVDFTTLIDNWQRLLDLTLSYHEALTTLEQEVAELEQRLGGPLERAHEELPATVEP
ncbi:MAG: TolC family protein [Myxococcales bacterium]|nr:TolC family protein [Myxococcales bacterium]